MVDFFRERKWDLVSRRWIYYLISLALLIAGLGTLVTNKYFWRVGPDHVRVNRAMNWGIDFTGGTVYTYTLGTKVPAAQGTKVIGDIRTALTREGITRAEIQLSGPPTTTARDRVIVRTQTETESKMIAEKDQVLALLKKDFPKARDEGQERVGALISKDLVTSGIAAIVVGSLLILIWISVRYEFKYAVCGIIALLHDVGVLVGSFALLYRFGLGAEVNSPFVAAVLTVLGYSVHDSVVIFDRIRENVRLRKRPTFAETVNISLLETMARSVNTVLTIEFTLLALFLLGGPSLRDFSLAMLIGVTIGGYSSIFNASQLLVGWKGREQLGRARATAAAEVRVAPAATRRQPMRPAPAAATETSSTDLSTPTADVAKEPTAEAASAAEAAPEADAAGQASRRKSKAKGKSKKRRRRY